MMKSIRVFAFAGALLAVLVSTSSFSSDEAEEGLRVQLRFDQACNTDIEKYCSKVQPGDGRIATCLYAHTDLLEDTCFDATGQIGAILEKVFDGIESFYAACQADLGQFCPGVESGGGQVPCLKEHLAEISAGCAVSLPGIR
jgi:Golgi apparatus protein 1